MCENATTLLSNLIVWCHISCHACQPTHISTLEVLNGFSVVRIRRRNYRLSEAHSLLDWRIFTLYLPVAANLGSTASTPFFVCRELDCCSMGIYGPHILYPLWSSLAIGCRTAALVSSTPEWKKSNFRASLSYTEHHCQRTFTWVYAALLEDCSTEKFT